MPAADDREALKVTTKARWYYSIDATCPFCDHYFDITQTPDFWDGRHFDLCEQGTPRTQGIEVKCPKCKRDMEVDLEY